MTSMIDVVFLLLIFFIVSASFVKTEREQSTTTKVDKKAAAAKSDLEIIVVDIVKAGNDYVYQVNKEEVRSDDELRSRLSSLVQVMESTTDVFVRAADDAPFDMAAQAIGACKIAGFLRVTYVPSSGK